MNIAHLIEWTARRFGNKVAFREGDRKLTFTEVDALTSRVAHGLAAIGIERGDRVALVLDNCLEFPLASFGTTKVGGVVVPLLINSTVVEMERWLGTAEVRAVFVASHAVEHVVAAFESLSDRPLLITVGDAATGADHDFDALVSGAPDTPFHCALTADDLFTIRFTGGTTRIPKGVTMNHRNYVSLYTNQLLNLPIDGTDVALHVHPLSHAAGQLMYGYFAAGATQVIHPAFRLNPDTLLRTIEQHGITSVFIIPTVLDGLVRSPALGSTDTSSLRSIIYGGQPMALDRLRAGQAAFGDVFVQVYGTSEAPQVSVTLTLEDHRFLGDDPPPRLRSAGREVLNVEVRVVDDELATVAPGVVGEIAIRGDNTMVAYWKNAELTAQRVRDGWVLTGDMGYQDDEGYFYLVDRKDDLIISGGFNVWPNEVETALYEHPDVEEAAVFGVEDPKWGEAVTAAVVARPGSALDEAAVIAFLQVRLSKYKVPKRVHMRSEPLPKSAVGKLLRRKARDVVLGTGGE